tara:strand:- start:1033 stop:1677 length:645 start_codon:yes stop_codon:yes gene_type:complete
LEVKVKLCGLKDKESLIAAEEANFIGFVFYQKSPRFINALEARDLKNFIKPHQKVVGLFVNADMNVISHLIDFCDLDFIQLHGNESIEYIKELKKFNKPIIKAISVKDHNDIIESKKFESYCDMILFDTKSEQTAYGGTGISFDWNLLKGYYSANDWMLAGGINKNNVCEALNITNAPIVDISSGVEKSKGIKCKLLIKELMKVLKNYEKKNKF